MRTRLPPSPTGFLHVGNLRTALYCYLLAKQTGDSFLLRIEDTDRERLVEGAVESVCKVLSWAGIPPDEGVMLDDEGIVTQKGDKGPYVQSERLSIYKEYADQLLKGSHAYYAFDTPEEIDQMREDQKKAGNPAPRYDASVRMRMQNSLTLSEQDVKAKIDSGMPYVVRLLVDPSETVTFEDKVRGKVEFKGHTIDDQVLLKSDGFPTYHLAHVVDDHLMEIDLVMRGEEWLSSLPKHILLFRHLGWELPDYAHVPLLLNQDKSKLSKRQNDVSVEDYIEQGYLPEALLNFLALLGWNTGDTKEIYTLQEMIDEFSLDRVQKASAVFDREKLDWIQGQWMRAMDKEEFVERALALVSEKYSAATDDPHFSERILMIQDRITFFKEAPEAMSYYYEEPKVTAELLANKKQKLTEELVKEILPLLVETLEGVAEADWNEEHLKETLFGLAADKGYKNGQILWPLRAAVTGLPFSPGAFEVASALGKEVTMERLKKVA